MSDFDKHDEATRLADCHSGYALAKMVIELRKEHDALAAHVERMKGVFAEGFETQGQRDYDAWEKEAKSLLVLTPAVSLSKRDLIQQARALEEVGHDELAYRVDKPLLLRKAAKIRQRANQLEAGQ